jgi:hypothetical protein
MTENYSPASMPPLRDTALPPEQDTAALPPLPPEQDTADVVKDQAADLGHRGVQAGKHTAGVAREQAAGVAAEAGRQGRDLLRQGQDQLGEQAAQGQQRLAAQLLSLSGQLSSMADGSGQNGVAADLARQAASRARDAGQWLGERGPAQVIDEVQSFARRRPAVFVVLAAGAGLVAGRLTRGLQAASGDGPAPGHHASPPADGWKTP